MMIMVMVMTIVIYTRTHQSTLRGARGYVNRVCDKYMRILFGMCECSCKNK
jgi:hypothetical protein